MALVEFQNVTRVYKTGDHELKALDGASFTSGNTSPPVADIPRQLSPTMRFPILGHDHGVPERN